MPEIRPRSPRAQDGLEAVRLIHFHGTYMFDGGAPSAHEEKALRAFVAYALEKEPANRRYISEELELPQLPEEELFYCGNSTPDPKLLVRDNLRWADEIELCSYWRIKTLRQRSAPGGDGDTISPIQTIMTGIIHLGVEGVTGEQRIVRCGTLETKTYWFLRDCRAIDPWAQLRD